MMNRKELAQLMGDAPALNAIGNNRAAYMRDVATRDDLLQALTECATQIRRMAQDQMSDVQEAMEAIPLTLNGQDEYDYDPEGVLNDLSIYAHAYDRIHVELIRRDNAKAKLVARAERAEKRRAKLKVVANG